MLLSFKRQLATKRPVRGKVQKTALIYTNFPAKIRNQEKIHTFRFGDRWRPGLKIHFWDESPRNIYADPPARAFTIPIDAAAHWSEEDEQGRIFPLCAAVETWDMVFRTDQLLQEQINFLSIGGKPIVKSWEVASIAKNDGLALAEFRAYFYNVLLEVAIEGLKLQGSYIDRAPITDQPLPKLITGTGQIIHWTDKVYNEVGAKCIHKLVNHHNAI